MTLFGSKHKHDRDAHHNTLEKPHHTTAGTGTGAYPATHEGTMGTTGATGTGMNPTYPGTEASNIPNNQHPYGVGHTSLGMGAAGPTTIPVTNIPPTRDVHHQPANTTTGTGTRLTGKVESALGSMVGSSALKSKGLEKEREANAVKMQSAELAEAERLEREALLRRERAVGHGAHPANSTLGAGSVGQGFGPGPNSGAGATGQYS
jgi:hypothetical protein